MDIRGKKGAWINQYALPAPDTFMDRAEDVDYLVVKHGLPAYERMAVEAGKPWLAEVMGELGAGSQSAYTQPHLFAGRLADQATQPGCIGAVINLEEADGGWHNDNGSGTRELIAYFHERMGAVRKPLYASLDTRGNRPDYPYQRVCAELCDGVMPMVYPKAFGQSVDQAFNAALTPKMLAAWGGKPIIPTIQTYGGMSVAAVVREVEIGFKFDGVTAYTLGHAAPEEWNAFVTTKPASQPASDVNVPAALAQLRVRWLETMLQLAKAGTPDEVAAFAAYWKKLTGKGV